jgi:septum formation protein
LPVDSIFESSPNAAMNVPIPLYLASTSRYRRELLARLGIAFVVEAPGVDETASIGEAAGALALRLAEHKARAVGERHPGALVLGSDQVAQLGDARLGKPVTTETAIAQLQACSGRTVEYATALCLFDSRSNGIQTHLDTTLVTFRPLTHAEIKRYVDADMPLDCAGGFRSESLGAALVDSIRSDDPSALIGMPLIATARLLRSAGFLLP